MSRLAFALFIATGLFFTAYFGAAAWRLSDDSHVEITGQIGRWLFKATVSLFVIPFAFSTLSPLTDRAIVVPRSFWP
jgi:hypothetical protein